mgnify:CR=1 FL=1
MSLFRGTAKATLYCAHRTICMLPPSLLCSLSRDGGLTDLPLRASNEGSPATARVARAQKIIRLHPLLCSASKKDGLAAPLPP